MGRVLGFLFWVWSLPALGAPVGYLVTPESQSLIQIARDVYKDERLWKKIATWNHMQPPYAIHNGQVLVLMETPVRKLGAHRVPDALVKAPDLQHSSSDLPSVKRQVQKLGAQWIYTVNERAPFLTFVARELYGDAALAKDIAIWNKLPSPFKIALHQQLILKAKPILSEQEGTQKLIAAWSEVGNTEMALRLGGTKSSEAKVQTRLVDTPSHVATVLPPKRTPAEVRPSKMASHSQSLTKRPPLPEVCRPYIEQLAGYIGRMIIDSYANPPLYLARTPIEAPRSPTSLQPEIGPLVTVPTAITPSQPSPLVPSENHKSDPNPAHRTESYWMGNQWRASSPDPGH